VALNANQDPPLSDAQTSFATLRDRHPSAVTEEASHVRSEVQRAVVVSAQGLPEHHDFSGLKALGRIKATRETDGATTSETRYFAPPWMPAPDVLLVTVRAHRAIQNALH